MRLYMLAIGLLLLGEPLAARSAPGVTGPTGAADSLIGTGLFFSRVYWHGSPVIELFNPSTTKTTDFEGWYLTSGGSTQKIGIPGNTWSVMRPLERRVLRRGEPGSFTFLLDEQSVLQLLNENFEPLERLAWSRVDPVFPDSCITRGAEGVGGFHDGWDWLTSGGEDDYRSGRIFYTNCPPYMQSGQVSVEPGVPSTYQTQVAPNPARQGSRITISFTLGAARGADPIPVRIRLLDAAGKYVGTVRNDALRPGSYALPINIGTQFRALPPGAYFFQIESWNGVESTRLTLIP